jgi:hypothetical protein
MGAVGYGLDLSLSSWLMSGGKGMRDAKLITAILGGFGPKFYRRRLAEMPPI